MAKRKRKKSKLVPILWLVIFVLGAYILYLNKGNIKSFIENQKNDNIIKKSSSSSSTSVKVKISSSSSESAKSESAKKENSTLKVKLYVAKMGDKFISLVPFEIEINKTATPLKDTLKALIDFRNENYLNLIPLNTKVNNVWIKNSYVYIDFSEEFEYNSYGAKGYNIQIYQVVYTATQFENIKGVYFYINGKEAKYLGGEGFIINNPVKPYTSLPKFSF